MATLGCFSQSAFYPVQSSMHAFVPTYDFSTPLNLETSTPTQGFQGIEIPFWSYLLLISSCSQVNLKNIHRSISKETRCNTRKIWGPNLIFSSILDAFFGQSVPKISLNLKFLKLKLED